MHLLRYNDIVGSFRKDFPGARSALVRSTHKIRHPRWMSSALRLALFVTLSTLNCICDEVERQFSVNRHASALWENALSVAMDRTFHDYDAHRGHVYLMAYVSSWIKQPLPAEAFTADSLSTPEIFIFYVTFGSSQSTTLTYKILRVTCVNKIS